MSKKREPYKQAEALKIISEIANGKSRKQIQSELGVTYHSIYGHIARKMRRYDANDVTHLAVKLVKEKII